MIRVRELSLIELFHFINDSIPIKVSNIDSEKCICDIEIKADFVTVNTMPTITIISVISSKVRNLSKVEVNKHTVTIDTSSYKEIILS